MGTGPLPQHTASLSPEAATVPTGTRTQTAGRWLSHCSPRGCAGLLQPQGSAQPASEVHFLPFRALDEGVVLKDAGRQSQPEAQVCSGGLAFSDPSGDARPDSLQNSQGQPTVIMAAWRRTSRGGEAEASDPTADSSAGWT